MRQLNSAPIKPPHTAIKPNIPNSCMFNAVSTKTTSDATHVPKALYAQGCARTYKDPCLLMHLVKDLAIWTWWQKAKRFVYCIN